MVTARELITYVVDVAIADSEDISAEFGITPHEADTAAWNVNLHWTQGKRDEPIIWQPRYGEELEENLAAYNGSLDVPLSLSDAPYSQGAPLYTDDELASGSAVATPEMDVHVTELERLEAQEYLSSGYNARLQTTISTIAERVLDAVRTLTIGADANGRTKPRRVTCRDIHSLLEANRMTYTYNTVRKVANALGAVGRMDRAGGGKGGEWRYGVKQ